MITINSVSGGKTSSYLAMNYKVDYNIFSLVTIDDQRCKPKDSLMIQKVNDKFEKYGFLQKYGEFIATAEDDKILKVMFDLEQMIGSEIVWVRHHSFDTWIQKKTTLPNMHLRYCTSELKIIPMCEFIVDNIFPKNDNQPVKMNLGIRWDESHRAKKGERMEYRDKIVVGKTSNGRNKWKEFFWAVANYPLIEDKVYHYPIQQYWKDKAIDFPADSNCIGCFWKDVQQLRKNWDDQPEKMRWFSEQEQENRNFFKPNIATYEQIKQVNIQQEFNFGTGSGCQAGFCTD